MTAGITLFQIGESERPALGAINRCKPPPSASFVARSEGLALRMRGSVGMCWYLGSSVGWYQHVYPRGREIAKKRGETV